MKNRVAPKIPLNNINGQYEYVYSDDLGSVVNQNLKMIMLCRKGERMFLPNFGVGIQEYLFEYPTQELEMKLRGVIINQLAIYASYITLNNLNIQFQENSMTVSIEYVIDENKTSHHFDITVEEQK